jgi:hypothetical protein
MSSTVETAGLPTVVLVHGAFADGSSWNGVIERLQAKGVQVTVPGNRCAESRATPPLSRACWTRYRALWLPSATPAAAP